MRYCQPLHAFVVDDFVTLISLWELLKITANAVITGHAFEYDYNWLLDEHTLTKQLTFPKLFTFCSKPIPAKCCNGFVSMLQGYQITGMNKLEKFLEYL